MATKNTVDPNNPMYIHPSDSPNIDLVSDVLKGSENYKIWSREITVALEVKNKMGFVDGSCKIPKDDEFLVAQWKRCNALVKPWIHRSISRELIHSVVYCESAHSIWLDLKERFDKVNGARMYALYREINTISQGTNNVSTYYSKLRNLWDEYESLVPSHSPVISKEYSDFCNQLRMMQFLMGLNECYSNSRSNILMMSPLPTHGHVYSIVSNEETQRGINQPTPEPPVTFYTNSQNIPNVPKKYIECEYCRGPGHSKANCFKIIGFPPNWRGGRGGRFSNTRGGIRGRFNNSGRGASHSWQSGQNRPWQSTQGPSWQANQVLKDHNYDHSQMQSNHYKEEQEAKMNFTPQQYNQLLQLINNQNTTSTGGPSTDIASSSNMAGRSL